MGDTTGRDRYTRSRGQGQEGFGVLVRRRSPIATRVLHIGARMELLQPCAR